jgi:hypothetical protein
MPNNHYQCSCGNEWTFIGPYKKQECSKCSTLIKPSIPTEIAAPSVMEVVDTYRNVKWRDNFKERAEKRNKFYNKKEAKERARIHGDSLEQHGITEDDAKMV